MFFLKKKSSDKIVLPLDIQGRQGIIAVPMKVLGDVGINSGYVLCIQDVENNMLDLSKVKNMHLRVKVGAANTTHGMIIFLLFTFWDTKKENDKFTYEVLINPTDKESYSDYLLLDKQAVWEVLLVHGENLLNKYKFNNTYNTGMALKMAIEQACCSPCKDFDAAKASYFSTYDIEALINS